MVFDQNEIKWKCDELTTQFDSSKAQNDEITTIADKQNLMVTIELFLQTLSEQVHMIESFDRNL